MNKKMDNKKIPTSIGTIIILIFAVTAGLFVWKYEEKQQVQLQDQGQIYYVKKSAVAQKPQESPVITDQAGATIEDAILNKNPDWKDKGYKITISTETRKDKYAIGKFSYDGGDQYKKGQGIWFGVKTDDGWQIAELSYVGYNGVCQNFAKYNFPSDMTPDCWDTEKNIQIETKNPKRFYLNGITEADKREIINSFISFIKEEDYAKYYTISNSYVLIIKNTENYLEGMMLKGGIENHSVPDFYATKIDGKWKVVFNGQDYPPCSIVDTYHFPHDIINKCIDEINKKEKDVL